MFPSWRQRQRRGIRGHASPLREGVRRAAFSASMPLGHYRWGSNPEIRQVRCDLATVCCYFARKTMMFSVGRLKIWL